MTSLLKVNHKALYISLISGCLFLLLTAVMALHPEGVGPLDRGVHAVIAPLQHGIPFMIMLIVTNFGNTSAVFVVFFVILVVFRHRPDLVTRLLISLLGVTISSEYLKVLLHRARPDLLPGLPRLASFSFPSGHSCESLVLYGCIAMILYIHAKTSMRRWLGVAACVLLILLIGGSRLVLGYHYASDVLGGYLLGAFWLSLGFAIPLSDRLYHWNANNSEPLDRPLV